MNIQEAYDNWSYTYDTDPNLTRDLDQVIAKIILMGLDSHSIVEIGCGTGKNTLWLSQIAERVHALDSSKAMLEKAKAKVNSTNVTFTVGDITKPWVCNNASADLITCNLVLEHIQDLSFIFSEASRVLVKGGYFFISELHPFKQYQGTNVMLRYGDRTIEVKEGDAISFPRGERIAHQFYNHTDEPVDILMMGENLPYEVCYFPDSDKWLSRSMGKVGKFESTDYWTDEPDPPLIKAQE